MKTRSVFWSSPCLVLKYLEFPRHQLHPCSSVKINGSLPLVMLRDVHPASIRKDNGKWATSATVLELGSLRACAASHWPLPVQRRVSLRKPSYWEVYNGSFSVVDQLFLYHCPPSPPLPAGLINSTSSSWLAWRDLPYSQNGSNLSVL